MKTIIMLTDGTPLCSYNVFINLNKGDLFVAEETKYIVTTKLLLYENNTMIIYVEHK